VRTARKELLAPLEHKVSLAIRVQMEQPVHKALLGQPDHKA
jgi:hypothetical protein